MRYLSVCSGIEAASVAWHPLGFAPVAFAETDRFPSAVLAHHYPDVPNWGDMTRFKEWPDATIDVLVGGTPCQSFSVAGLRAGLADPRGNLALTYLGIADRYRPAWVVWENVPGVLSSGGGRDFGAFLGGLGELGYGFAYRELDAQYFGLAQRRRRVFVVGYLGDWRRAAAVLFERESLSGHPAPRREAWEGIAAATAPSLTASGRGVERTGESRGQDPVIAVAHSLRANGFDASEDGIGRGTPLVPIAFSVKDHGADAGDIAPTLRAGGHTGSHANGGVMPAIAFAHQTAGDHTTSMPIGRDFSPTLKAGPSMAVAFDARQSDVIQYGDMSGPLDTDGHTIAVAFRSDAGRDGEARTPSADAEGRVRLRDPGFNVYEECAPTLDASAPHGVGYGMQVRRLTPRECERLQGFPDDYTLIPYHGKPAADGPRYKALGNSMAVPCMAWIGRRIKMVEELA